MTAAEAVFQQVAELLFEPSDKEAALKEAAAAVIAAEVAVEEGENAHSGKNFYS